jgi:hypothetical protein
MRRSKTRRISVVAGVLGVALLLVGVVTSGNPVSAATETVAPELTAVARTSPGTFVPPGDVTVSYTAADSGSGIAGVTALFLAPNGNFVISNTATTASGTLTVSLDASSPSGVYLLAGVRVIDKATVPNDVTYGRDGSITTSSQDTTGPTTHSINFSAADFTVDNDGGDVTNPVLTAVSRTSPATMTGPGNITLGYTASDANDISFVGGGNRAPPRRTDIAKKATPPPRTRPRPPLTPTTLRTRADPQHCSSCGGVGPGAE